MFVWRGGDADQKRKCRTARWDPRRQQGEDKQILVGISYIRDQLEFFYRNHDGMKEVEAALRIPPCPIGRYVCDSGPLSPTASSNTTHSRQRPVFTSPSLALRARTRRVITHEKSQRRSGIRREFSSFILHATMRSTAAGSDKAWKELGPEEANEITRVHVRGAYKRFNSHGSSWYAYPPRTYSIQ